MSFLLAVLVVFGFAALLDVLRLPTHARDVMERGQQCMAVLQNASMPDAAKEEALQAQARRLFLLLGILVGGSLMALGLPLALIWALGLMGLGSFSEALAILQRLDFLLGTILFGGLAFFLIRYARS